MSTLPTLIRLGRPEELNDYISLLPEPSRPAVLLSASVPYVKEGAPDMSVRERADQRQTTQRYFEHREPARIRAAVVALTLAALARRVRLIFGAHPAITPMVLAAALDVGGVPGSILIFQSEFFERRLPEEAWSLAKWSAGSLLMTPLVRAGRPTDSQNQSLTVMRSLMVASPLLRGAVFVGGMDGIKEEARLFRQKHRALPQYAIASTGSAAQEMFESAPGDYSGTLQDPSLLVTCPSYALLGGLILDNMGLGGAQPSGATALP